MIEDNELKLLSFLAENDNKASLGVIQERFRDSGLLFLSLRRQGEVSIRGVFVEGEYEKDSTVFLEPQGQLRLAQARQVQPQLTLADAHGPAS